MMAWAALLLLSVSSALLLIGVVGAQTADGAPELGPAFTEYTSCGVTHTLTEPPSRVVTMNQGATELMLAMSLEDKMAGAAYLDDEIWPRYAEVYAGVPVLSATYPTETQILQEANADFIIGSYKSAFREKDEDGKGIFSDATVGPCAGALSDFFPSGSNETTSYSTCRPQLHAAGVGTWLEPPSCEDSALRPQGGATEETVYAIIEEMGRIFDVPTVAKNLISEIKQDFDVAERAVESLGQEIKAVWLDCIGRCCVDEAEENGQDPDEVVFVGAGMGAPNLIMSEAGLTNIFADLAGSWKCVNVTDIIAADPDVIVIVDAAWDTALGKVDHLHNHSGWCCTRAVQGAEYITIPFSASTLGPRNGAAALDMISAALHVTTGETTLDFKSGVTFFDPEVIKNRTESLLCPVDPAYGATQGTAPTDGDGAVAAPASSAFPTWGIVLLVILGVLFIAAMALVAVMITREKRGEPMFQPLLPGGQAEPNSDIPMKSVTMDRGAFSPYKQSTGLISTAACINDGKQNRAYDIWQSYLLPLLPLYIVLAVFR